MQRRYVYSFIAVASLFSSLYISWDSLKEDEQIEFSYRYLQFIVLLNGYLTPVFVN